jgi:hypothetical protein
MITRIPLIIACAAVACCTAGCWKRDTQRTTRAHLVGTFAGQPLDVTADLSSSEQTTSGVDPQALAGLVTTAVKAAIGGTTGGVGFGGIIGGAGVGSAALSFLMGEMRKRRDAAEIQRQREAKEKARQEAEAAWDAERDAQIRAAKLEQPPKETT